MYLIDGVEHCSMELSSTKMAYTRIVTILGTCLWDGLFFHGANLNKNSIYQNNSKTIYLSNGVEHCSMELSSTRAAGNGIFSSSLTRSSRKLTLCLNNKIVLLMWNQTFIVQLFLNKDPLFWYTEYRSIKPMQYKSFNQENKHER